jgi:hypothetical protein
MSFVHKRKTPRGYDIVGNCLFFCLTNQLVLKIRGTEIREQDKLNTSSFLK